VTVSAFDVEHGALIKPSFGYKIEYDGKTVVISGDTTRDERVARQAAGADLLIHEVADIDPALMEKFPRFREITDHHTTPEQAGEIFSMARPKLAAYSHIIALKPGQALAEDQDTSTIIARTRTAYDGPLVAGTDLMSLVIGDDDVTVRDASGAAVFTD
jgi:ribonuclease Z